MGARDLAQGNFETHIQQNVYPGRGLVIGRASDEDTWLMVYWIMGRSASSRNRHFVVSGNTVRTEPVDTSHMEHPELLIYEAMLELPDIYLVSNGDQTRTLYDMLQAGGSFDAALATREREPDAPHYTPRISGMLAFQQDRVEVTLSILKANKVDPAYTDRVTYRPVVPAAGFGVGLTTYMGDGNPLPSFAGDALVLPLVGGAEEVLDSYWNGLNSDNRISLAIKEIMPDQARSRVLVRNRF
jgi:IMP cyclohydrolase